MSSDRRAVFLLLFVAAAGAAVRIAGRSDVPAGAIAYRAPSGPPRGSLDSAAVRATRASRPLRRGDRIDLDAAGPEEIARLPRIGPGLARRIVADRDRNGPFGSLGGLDRVSGVGPSLLKEVEPFAVFSGRARAAGRGPVSLNTATASQLDQLPGIGPARARAIVEYRSSHGPFRSLDDLLAVPGMRKAVVRGLEGRISLP